MGEAPLKRNYREPHVSKQYQDVLYCMAEGHEQRRERYGPQISIGSGGVGSADCRTEKGLHRTRR